MNTSFVMLLALVIFLGAGFGGSFVGGVIYGQTLQDDESELSPRLGAAGQFPGGQETADGGQRGQGRPEQGGGFGAAQGAGGQAASRRGGGAGNSEGGAGRPGQVGGLEASESPGGSAADRQNEGQDSASEQQVSEHQSDGQNNQDGQQRERLERGGQRESTDSDSQSDPAPNAEEPASQGTTNVQAGPGDSSDTVPAGSGGSAGTIQGIEGDALMVASPRGELTVMLSDSTTVFQVSETTREALTADARVRVIGSRSPEGEIAAQSVVIVPEGVESLFSTAGARGGRQRGGGP